MTLRLWFVLVAGLFLCSCAVDSTISTESTYPTHKMHVPFFHGKGQTEVEGSYSGAWNVAGGYSIGEEWAVVGSAQLSSLQLVDSNSHASRFIDVGGGYIFPSSSAFRLEGFVRFGIGSIGVHDQFQYDSLFGQLFYDFEKYGLQVNVGWEWERWMLAASYRGGLMRIRNVDRTVTAVLSDSVVRVGAVPRSTSYYDVGITVRYKLLRDLGLELQVVPGAMNDPVGFAAAGYRNDTGVTGLYGLGLTYRF